MRYSTALLGVGAFLVSGLLATAGAPQSRPDTPDNPDPVEYCKSAVNSTGFMSHAMVVGNLSISENDTWLYSYSCPPDTYGVFLMGETQGHLPFGNGHLCISPFESPIYYAGAPGLTDYIGASYLHLDMENPQLGGRILPGSTWNFQCYYRDLDAGGACFNLSSGVAATFVN